MSTQKIKEQDSDNVRFAVLEHSIISINNSLIRIETRFDKIDNEFKEIRDEFKDIRNEMKSDFRWLVTIFGGLIIGLTGLMAHGFHWI